MELVSEDARSVLTVSEIIFGCDFSEALVHQVVVAYAVGIRQGICAQKIRAEVTGPSKKSWCQKGTGCVHSGSTRGLIWRSGGVTFVACPQDYSQKVNKKMYRDALKSIPPELVRQDRPIVVEKSSVEAPKTKPSVQRLKDVALEDVLIITSELDENLFLAARSLHKADVRDATGTDLVSLVAFDKVVMTADAAK